MSLVVGCHHLPPGPLRHTCIVMNPVVGCHHLPPGPQRHTCIVMSLVMGYHHLPPDPQRHTCIVMSLMVGCYHLPPGPQWHICIVMNPAVGGHYFLPGHQLPSHPSGVADLNPVPTYTAWWQRHIGERNFPGVFTPCAQLRLEPTTAWTHDRKSDSAMTPAP